MRQYLLPLALGILLLLKPAFAFAVAEEGIAAVVNDSVITVTDVKDRTDLYLSTSDQNIPAAQRKSVEQQVLNRLIDEALQLQEAKKLGIVVGDYDIENGFTEIARQNKSTPEAFRKHLTDAGVRVQSLDEQIRANIAWAQVVRRRITPQINVGEGEIDMTMEQIAGAKDKTQYHVAEIFLNVPSAPQENDVRADAEKLVKQITEGASFSSVAHAFSQAPGASAGGDMGWIQEGLLEPALDAALAKMHPGQISPPIRSAKGFHILFLRELRQSATTSTANAAAGGPIVTLKQILIPVTEKDSKEVIGAKMARGHALKGEIKSCDNMAAKMKDFAGTGTGEMSSVPQNSLPDELRAIVEKMKVGEVLDPVRNPQGVAVIMLCSRNDAPTPTASAAPAKTPAAEKNDEASRDKVAAVLGNQRVDQMAGRYLRDLRATAFIDKRI